jgi:GT2 family glycosyltransferase
MAHHIPLVSLIVVSYNEVENISNTLSALMRQTYPRYEIIVYDNKSSDGTPEYIFRNFTSIQLIRGKENLGFSGANNEAAKIAQGKYLAFVNDDAYVSSSWLEPLVEILETDPTVGCAGAELLCSEKRDEILCHGNGIHLSGIAYVHNRGKIARAAPPMEVGGISGAAFLMSRELFKEIGGFESLFFLYYEDTDLSLRLRLFGKRCMVVPGARVYHNCESRFRLSKVFYLERNRYLSIFSLMSIPMLLLMAPSILAFEIISWGYCLLRGKEAIRSKANAWNAIYGYRSWIKERRRKYLNRKVNTAYVIGAFTPIIKVDYVHTNNILGWLAGVLGYLVAAPAFLPFVFRHKKEH